MKAEQARKMAEEAKKSFEYEYQCVMEQVYMHANRGKMFMPAPPLHMSNQLREKLIQDGYTITNQTIYWQITPMTKQ